MLAAIFFLQIKSHVYLDEFMKNIMPVALYLELYEKNIIS